MSPGSGVTEGLVPGWDPDPVGLHQFRYWDGSRWTEQVEDFGVRAEDPMPGSANGTQSGVAPPPPVLPPPAPALVGEQIEVPPAPPRAVSEARATSAGRRLGPTRRRRRAVGDPASPGRAGAARDTGGPRARRGVVGGPAAGGRAGPSGPTADDLGGDRDRSGEHGGGTRRADPRDLHSRSGGPPACRPGGPRRERLPALAAAQARAARQRRHAGTWPIP